MDDTDGFRILSGLQKFGAEATNVEAKASRQALPKSTKESVVAFANSSRGGTVVLGVDETDNFRPVGVDDAHKIQADLASSCSNEIVPPIRAEISFVSVDGVTLVVAEVPPLGREQKPAYVKALGMDRGSFIRVGESDRRLTAEEIQQLIADRGQPSFDRSTVPGTDSTDLDAEMLARYVSRLRESQPSIFSAEDVGTILRFTTVTTRQTDGSEPLTMAGLLAMGRYPQQHFPQLNATLVVYGDQEGADAGEVRFLDNQRFDGPLPTIVREVMAALRRNMSRRSLVTGDGRRDIYDYPPEALREIVVNALVHRDLSPGARGTQVQIEMFPDRIVFKNPGGLFGSIDITLLGEEGRSSARNATLLKMLEDVSVPGEDQAICENRGSGIRAAKRALRDAGMTPMSFNDSVTAFQVSMPNHALFDSETVQWLSQIGQGELRDSQAVGLAMMRRGEVLDNATYRGATGIRDSHQARMDLQDLVARELADQLGTRGGTKYVISPYAAGLRGEGRRGSIRPDRRRQIVSLLALHSELSKTEISNRLGAGAKTIEHWLRRLKQEGLVISTDQGRGAKFTRYRLADQDEDTLFTDRLEATGEASLDG